MKWTSIIAIYFLFWVLSAFVVMPFHVKTAADVGDSVGAGHADSAPVNFQPKRILAWNTLVATAAFGLFYANYVFGWITPEMLAFER